MVNIWCIKYWDFVFGDYDYVVLASDCQAGESGCFDGFVTDLARTWLEGLSATELGRVAVYACGPNPMLKATAALSASFGLPCQVSMEEFMACAVGGCAGCTVLTNEDGRQAMRRVCVDGPVFDAQTIEWESLPH